MGLKWGGKRVEGGGKTPDKCPELSEMLSKKNLCFWQCGWDFRVLACADTLARTPLGVRQYSRIFIVVLRELCRTYISTIGNTKEGRKLDIYTN